MESPETPEKIVISPAMENDSGMLLKLYAEIFSQREPLTSNLGFTKERIVSIAEAMYLNQNNDSLRQGLWLKATLGRDTGKPVGFIVTGDISVETPNEPPAEMKEEEMAKVPAVMVLLEEVRRPLNEQYSFGRGQCLHIAALGVDSGWEGLGVAGRLLGGALARAKEVGYTYAASECTGSGSQRCHEKHGFRSLHSVEYAGFEYGGPRPFAAIPGECHLMIKGLC